MYSRKFSSWRQVLCYKYQYQYQTFKHQYYKYQYLTRKYKYQYLKNVLIYSSSTSTKYNSTAYKNG